MSLSYLTESFICQNQYFIANLCRAEVLVSFIWLWKEKTPSTTCYSHLKHKHPTVVSRSCRSCLSTQQIETFLYKMKQTKQHIILLADLLCTVKQVDQSPDAFIVNTNMKTNTQMHVRIHTSLCYYSIYYGIKYNKTSKTTNVHKCKHYIW